MNKRCLVAICFNGASVPVQTARSCMEIGWGSRIPDAKAAHGFDAIDFHWEDGSPRVDAMRDAVIVQAQKRGYTHVLFLDADMVWPTDVLTKMLRHHDKGIVSGLYFMKGGAFQPVAMRDGRFNASLGVMEYEHDWAYEAAGDDLRPEEIVGMGCTLIPLAVFDAIGPRPWFRYEDNREGWPVVSEDVPLCRKAAAAGFGIWLDPTVKCGHVKSFVVTEQWRLALTQDLPMLLMKHAAASMERVEA